MSDIIIKADIQLSQGEHTKSLTEDNIISMELEEPGGSNLLIIDLNKLYHCETHKLFDDSYYPSKC